jgi:predicted DNA-binding protein (UPF0251 family)
MTMRKLLVEFLIQRKYVTEADAIGALQEQCAQLPTLSEVATRLELLNPKDHLNILLVQAKGAWSFQQAAKQLGLWNSTLERQLNSEIKKLAVPLTELLIKKGALTTDTLLRAYREFSEPERTALNSNFEKKSTFSD